MAIGKILTLTDGICFGQGPLENVITLDQYFAESSTLHVL